MRSGPQAESRTCVRLQLMQFWVAAWQFLCRAAGGRASASSSGWRELSCRPILRTRPSTLSRRSAKIPESPPNSNGTTPQINRRRRQKAKGTGKSSHLRLGGETQKFPPRTLLQVTWFALTHCHDAPQKKNFLTDIESELLQGDSGSGRKAKSDIHVGTREGTFIARTIRSVLPSDRHDIQMLLAMRGTPWSMRTGRFDDETDGPTGVSSR